MCGIVGVFEPKGFASSSDIEARVRRAADAAAYRGPDASGYFALPKEGIAFGHRRLSILDLEVRSNQPMSSADGDILLTYNGEIYNFRELRSALEGEGAVFRTKSDTEVLIEGYRAWGLTELLKRSVGMFAFALFDKKERLLYLARDRAGQKPLFYSRLSSGGIVFGSEIRSILILKPEARALDPAGLDAYLSLKMTPSPRTLFKGVQKLPPGHF